MQQVFVTDEVFVIVDIETRSLRKDNNIYSCEEDAWSMSRSHENATVVTLEEWLKEVL